MMRWSLYAIAIAGCGTSGSQNVTASAVVEASTERPAANATVAPEAPCTDPAVIVEAGHERGLVCPDAAAGRGLVIVDLQDAWTRRLFAPQPSGTAPRYRATYLALAAEHDAAGKPVEGEDALGELYGVVAAVRLAG